GTALALRLNALLVQHESPADAPSLTALVQLSAPDAMAALQAFADKHDDLDLLDLTEVAGSLASAWRAHLLRAMAAAAALLALLVTVSMRSWRRSARVLWPVALGTLLTCGLLHATGHAFTLFHLVALVLAA